MKQRKQNTNDASSADDTADDSVSAEELSEFYKQFLDDNYQLHRNYNRSDTDHSNGN